MQSQSRLFLTTILLCFTLCFCIEESCKPNEVEVTFFRQFMSFGSEEYVYVYETAVPDNVLVYINTLSQTQHNVTVIKCLKMDVEHEIRLKDTFGDGWTKGSYLNVTYDDTVVFGKLRLDKGANATHHFTINGKVEPPANNPPIWIWISLIALVVVAAIVAIVIKNHSKKSTKQQTFVSFVC